MKETELKSINIPVGKNPLLQQVLDEVNSNTELLTMWKIINVNALDRLHMSDHGIVHFQIVANSALRICRILNKKGIDTSIKTGFGLSNDHGEVVVFLGSIMHDLGMIIHRNGHEEFSLFLANNLLHGMLNFLPAEEKVIVISEVLHSIIGHRGDGEPYTLEAGIVRIADALDMSQGRARVSFEQGFISIYQLSGESITKVYIEEGTDKPIDIGIQMHNSAGLFQVDDLLRNKLKGSGLENYIKVTAKVVSETDGERKMLEEIVF